MTWSPKRKLFNLKILCVRNNKWDSMMPLNLPWILLVLLPYDINIPIHCILEEFSTHIRMMYNIITKNSSMITSIRHLVIHLHYFQPPWFGKDFSRPNPSTIKDIYAWKSSYPLQGFTICTVVITLLRNHCGEHKKWSISIFSRLSFLTMGGSMKLWVPSTNLWLIP